MSKENLNKALFALQKSAIVAKKSSTAKGEKFSYTYAELEEIWGAIRKPLIDNGLLARQYTVVNEGNYLVTTLVHVETGEESEPVYVELKNTKGDMQGEGSAITYARRYGLVIAVGVITEDDDGNTASQSTYNKPQPTPSKPLGDTIEFGKKYKGKQWSEVPLDYLQWLVDNGFNEQIKNKASDEIANRIDVDPTDLDKDPFEGSE